MSTIKAVTNDNNLIITSRPLITSGSKNVNELTVVFDKSWEINSAEYFVNFYVDDENDGMIRKFEVIGSVGRCSIPYYVTEKEGFFHFGVFAKADNDVVKTSDVAGYEVGKGICIQPRGDEHDTAFEIKKKFIDLINANMGVGTLTYDMRFEDIDISFTNYMNQLHGETSNFDEMSDGLYTLVRDNIDPEIIRIDDPVMGYLSYYVALEEYFRNQQIHFDSESAENEEFKISILNLIREYIDPDFGEDNSLPLYSSAIEDYLSLSAQAVEEIQNIKNTLYDFYTGGNT